MELYDALVLRPGWYTIFLLLFFDIFFVIYFYFQHFTWQIITYLFL